MPPTLDGSPSRSTKGNVSIGKAEGMNRSLVCPVCGWIYGSRPLVPSHTKSVRWGAKECPGAGAQGIPQPERVEGKRS